MPAIQTIAKLMEQPRHITMPEQVTLCREIVNDLAAKGMSNRDAYQFLEDMMKTFERATWRLKDNAFHAMSDSAIAPMKYDNDIEY